MLEGRRFWFVGIGGAGMSALALVTKEWGAEVGGSDRARSSYVERLEAAGIAVAIGHDAANVPEGAEVIVSSAIGPDNPEVAAEMFGASGNARKRSFRAPVPGQVTEKDLSPRSSRFDLGRRICECSKRNERSANSSSIRNSAP